VSIAGGAEVAGGGGDPTTFPGEGGIVGVGFPDSPFDARLVSIAGGAEVTGGEADPARFASEGDVVGVGFPDSAVRVSLLVAAMRSRV